MRIHSGYIYFIPYTSFIIHGDFIYDHLWSFVVILRFSMFQKLISDLFRSQNPTRIQTRNLKNIQKYFKNPELQKRTRTRAKTWLQTWALVCDIPYVGKPDPNSIKLEASVSAYLCMCPCP